MCAVRSASTRRACAGSHQFHNADFSIDREADPEHPLKTNDDCIRHAAEQLQWSETKLCVRSHGPELRNNYRDMGATVLLERPRV